MRLLGNGNLGIGTTSPTERLEVYNTGDVATKVTRVDATADPARRVVSKKRVADNGQTKSGDIILRDEYKGHDQDGDELTIAKMEVKTIEDTHDVNGLGSEFVYSVMGLNEIAFTEILKLRKDGVQIQGSDFNELSDKDDLAHSGINHNLFTVDSTKYRAFEATVYGNGTDTTPDQRTVKSVINGFYDGSNWIVTQSHDLMKGNRLWDIDFTDAATITVFYSNNLDQALFGSGKWTLKVRRFAA